MPNMSTEGPSVANGLLPSEQNRSPQTRSILQDAQLQDANTSSQSPESLEDEDGSGNEKPKRQKRSRACIACRGMKIRCLPVEGQEACSSCAKVNRQCVMPGPPRKRQKTVHKVAELEKKINALTAVLKANGQSNEVQKTPDDSPAKDTFTSASSDPARTDDTPNTSVGSYDRNVPERMGFYDRNVPERTFTERTLPEAGQPQFSRACIPTHVDPSATDNYVDVIERGDLSMDTAASMFKYWMKEMSPKCPIVVFPAATEAQEIRTRRPMTFLTILTVTSSVLLPSAQPALTVELNRQIAERVLFHGDKNLDLIQAMLLNAQYYIRPRSARDMAFNQNINAATVMCLELGIGKRSKLKRTPAEEVELCRTWLACYHASTSVSTLLRIPTFAKFGPREEECLEVLSTSPQAAPSDKWFCAIVGITRIAEEVGMAFNMHDPGAEVNFMEPRIQYQLKCFQRQLLDWEKCIDASLDRRLAQHMAACLNLYMHEIAIHIDHNVDDFRVGATPSKETRPSTFVTSGHVEALSTLLDSSHRVLDSYLSLDTACARTLSNLYIVWNAYAVVVLIKLHWILNAPDSQYGSVFIPDLRTGFYLDTMLNKLAEISADGKSPCAEAFGLVFKKLKIWHLRRAGQLTDDDRGAVDDNILQKDTLSIMHAAKSADYSNPEDVPLTRPFTPAILPGQWGSLDKVGTSDLNAAYDAASYGNTNWDQFNFSAEEMNLFNVYMNNSGWMGYLL